MTPLTALLILAVLCLAFAVAFGLTDRYDDQPDDEFQDISHCHVIKDQEPAA